MNRRQIKNIEAKRCELRHLRRDITQGAERARKQFVPRRKTRALALHDHRLKAAPGDELRLELRRYELLLRFTRQPARTKLGGDFSQAVGAVENSRTHLEVHRFQMRPALGVMPPTPPLVNPAFDRKLPTTECRWRKGGCEFIVRASKHRDEKLTAIGSAQQEPCADDIVTVGENVGADAHRLVDDAAHGEVVEARSQVLDDHPPARVHANASAARAAAVCCAR